MMWVPFFLSFLCFLLVICSNFMESEFNSHLMRPIKTFCVPVIIMLLFGCNILDPESGNGSAPEGAVDLGLSVKWATCNLGASSPEQYGDYFAWGETKPKDTYDWSNYKFALPGIDYDVSFSKYVPLDSYGHDESYGKPDNRMVLELEDDAAHSSLGRKWRIPTSDEWFELEFFCDWEWTTLNGVKGAKVTADNGKWIFLPAAGSKGGKYDSSNGEYWSSSLYGPSANCARQTHFSPTYHLTSEHEVRYKGLSVRPVSD